jgi:DnaJ-class molecular chaperone
MKDYYAILDVARDSSTRQIKRAYKKLARQWHPDLHPQDPACRTRIQEINEAYEVLSDPAKWKDYDYQFQEGRANEQRDNGFYLDPHEEPFFRYFREMSDAFRKKAQRNHRAKGRE